MSPQIDYIEYENTTKEKANEPQFVDFDKSTSANTAKKILNSMSDEQKTAIQHQTLDYMNTADDDND